MTKQQRLLQDVDRGRRQSNWARLTASNTLGIGMASSGLSPFPAKFATHLQYSLQGTFTSGTSGVTATEVLMNLNGIWKPNSGSTNQPNMYDQISPIYGRYLVERVGIDLSYTNALTSQAMLCFAQIRADSGAPTTTAVDPILVKDYYGVQSKICTDTGNDALVRFRFQVSPAEVFGLTPQQYRDDPQYSGLSATANPTRLCFLAMNAGSTTGTVSKTVSWILTMHFFVTFMDRIVFTNS